MNVEDLLPFVRPFTPNCPERTRREAVVHAARKFADLSRWHTETVNIESVKGQADYDLFLDDGANLEPSSVLAVQIGKTVLNPSVPLQERNRWGHPRVFWFMVPNILVIMGKPEKDGADIAATVVGRPTLAATELPDSMIEKVSLIAEGAVAWLMQFPDRPWSNPEGIGRWAKFESDCISAGSTAAMSHAPRGYRVVPHV